jgi:hypothetical protein
MLIAVLVVLLSAGVTAAIQTAKLLTISGQQDDIATVVSGSQDDPHLEILRHFRDSVLLTNPAGAFFWTTYATISPPIAEVLLEHEHLRTATRILLLMSVVYLAALCLNTIALLAFFVLILLVLAILRRHLKTVLKGVLYGLLASAAFAVAAVTLGGIGYELPLCAMIAAYLLPVIIPVGLAVCVTVWVESRAPASKAATVLMRF